MFDIYKQAEKCIRLNDLNRLNLLINSDLDVNVKYDFSLLEFVAKFGTIEAIKILISAGARVNKKIDSSNYFLEEDAFDEYSPSLFVASEIGRLDVVKELIASGAQVNGLFDGDSAIEIAARSGQAGVYKYLLKYSNQFLIDRAKKVVKKQKELNKKLEDFFNFVSDNEIEKVLSAISSGIDVNSIDEMGSTALTIASSFGYEEMIRELLYVGASPDYRKNNSLTPLIKLIYECYSPRFRTVKDENTKSLFIPSVNEAKEIRIAKLLLKSGADVNLQNLDGKTALMIASQIGHYEMVKLLLNFKADITIVDNNNNSAIDYALNSFAPSAKGIVHFLRQFI
jgi:ankyrin repeat protein